MLRQSIVIYLSINGQEQEFQEPLAVGQLLEKMNLQGKRLAIEKNGEIVPRSSFENTYLKTGDKIEIVVAVGGG